MRPFKDTYDLDLEVEPRDFQHIHPKTGLKRVQGLEFTIDNDFRVLEKDELINLRNYIDQYLKDTHGHSNKSKKTKDDRNKD